MIAAERETINIVRPGKAGYWIGRFTAMAGPCEVFVDTESEGVAKSVIEIAAAEAKRIETKYSRYRDDNIVARINLCETGGVKVDDETARLLDYANQCYRLSEGKFDITSGVLRKLWRFDRRASLPDAGDVESLLANVGWTKASWDYPLINLAEGMEIDFGGVGKEYAVDRAAQLVAKQGVSSVLINFGGDLVAVGPRRNDDSWRVAIEPLGPSDAVQYINIQQGAIATSGDTKRFIEMDGKRFGHILDPQTGYPVVGAPRTITVVANTCLEAGMLATIAMLQGYDAEEFLDAQGVQYCALRD